jgi:hypothetical protein
MLMTVCQLISLLCQETNRRADLTILDEYRFKDKIGKKANCGRSRLDCHPAPQNPKLKE